MKKILGFQERSGVEEESGQSKVEYFKVRRVNRNGRLAVRVW